jgi:ABC-2 type transport system permease protein
MRALWELVQRSFQRQITYRAATVAGLLTNLFFGVLRASVMVALYGQRIDVEGINIQEAITYTGISQAVIGFLSLFSWYELMNTVYSGAVASDLLKPIGYYRYWLSHDLGRAAAQFSLRTIPIMLGYAFLFDITYPDSARQWLALAVAIFLAWLVSFSFRFIVNLASFWVPNATGIARFAFILMWFLSGFMMPLRFFPDWFVTLSSLTPFPYMVNTVVEVYLGLVAGRELIIALFAQLVWAALLMLIGQFILRAGLRRLVILGG